MTETLDLSKRRSWTTSPRAVLRHQLDIGRDLTPREQHARSIDAASLWTRHAYWAGPGPRRAFLKGVVRDLLQAAAKHRTRIETRLP